MFDLGKVQELTVIRKKDFGIYLGVEDSPEAQGVLLPKKQVPEGTKIGDKLEVFLYKDSKDRLIATTSKPMLQLGEVGLLEVAECSKIGAFLSWGLEKDLFLPFKEQSYPVRKGEKVLVALYADKSQRLCATMKVYGHLRADSPYQEGDTVTATIYRINPEMGLFVAVDNCYYGMIPKKDLYQEYRTGSTITATVVRVREDGKLDLGLRKKAYLQIEEDSEKVMQVIEEFDGVLPFGEKVSPEIIKREFSMSKNAYRRALGHLLKQGKIEIKEKSIRRL